MAQQRIVCLMGPTASGKTALAIDLVKRFPFEIISVDSALVYKGMDIGTAKPSAAELAAAPHRLISILDPSEAYSVSQFRVDALSHIQAIWAKGKTPLLVGGTMLYFRALLLGLSDMPSADARIRAQIDADAQAHGWQHVHNQLAEVDSVSAARLNVADAQRVQRALEVYRLTGKPISQFQDLTGDHKSSVPNYANDIGPDPIQLALMPADRAVLHARIERRFDQMLAAGFLDEVKALYERSDLSEDMPAIRAVGYRQAWAYLSGQYDYAEMRYRGVVATRQLAKRQLTWLRNWQGVTPILSDASGCQRLLEDGTAEPLFDSVAAYLQSEIEL